MTLNYEGWCRRIDLLFRARFPYLFTRLFKVSDSEFQLYLVNGVDNFTNFEEVFNREVRYMTAPIKLVREVPVSYDIELMGITDEEIPSNFEGLAYTINEMYIFIASTQPEVGVSSIEEDHIKKEILVELEKNSDLEKVKAVQETVEALKLPYSIRVSIGNSSALQLDINDEVFNIAPSQSKKSLGCPFIERDEILWYDNLCDIYNGSFRKQDLYFFDQSKTGCLVNFAKFHNANLRNHLLLYDVVYCVLPFAENMSRFLSDQKISREEILDLVKRGRLKIINMQPEVKLDYGFINEAFQESPSSVISRRALSALFAIDLVELNRSYIFSDPELDKYTYHLFQSLSDLVGKDIDSISNFLLWPKQALRRSLDTLNKTGPMGISRFGVNIPIIDSLPTESKKNVEFEFVVSSDQVHLAHALNATYFPFFIEGQKYSDHPFALMMGGLLNFYKNVSYHNLGQVFDIEKLEMIENPTLSLISLFDINDYISISEFENEISSRLVRDGMNGLFAELGMLDVSEREVRISKYNKELEVALRNKNITKYALDLGEDSLGMVVPFLATGKRLLTKGTEKAMERFSVIKEVSEFIEDKTMTQSSEKRRISILSKVNRVARLKKNYE